MATEAAPSAARWRNRMMLFGLLGVGVIAAIIAAVIAASRDHGGQHNHTAASQPPVKTTADGGMDHSQMGMGGGSMAHDPTHPMAPTSKGSTDHMGNMKMGPTSAAGPPTAAHTMPMPSSSGSSSSSGSGGQHSMDMGGMNMGAMGMNITGCDAKNARALQHLVEHATDCDVVTLSQDYYMCMNQIKVRRRVTVLGDPVRLPELDASMALRAFKVLDGGFLELKFVRLHMGMGTIRKRGAPPKPEEEETMHMQRQRHAQAMPGMDMNSSTSTMDMSTVTDSVMTMRGSGVAVEGSGEGATFVGVIFLCLRDTAQAVQDAVTQTVNNVGMRMYGGHVFIAGGTVSFVNSHFYDSFALTPLNDQVMVGGDVLLVSGSVFFTGCSFTSTMLLGSMQGLGLQVAVLGGTATFTFCTIQTQGLVQNMAGAGWVFFCGGGVMVMTGVDFRNVVGAMASSGIGNFFAGMGVMVQTGMTISTAWGVMVMLGAGYYQAVGSGVHVQSGVTYAQAMGPNYMAMTGGSIFVGSGSSINTGVSSTYAMSTSVYHGQGQWWYNGAGYSHIVGCPISLFMSTMAFMGLGGLYSQPAGELVFVGNPIVMAAAVMYFAGLGTVMFIGGGSSVLGYSPVYMPTAVMYANPEMAAAFWINGNDRGSSCGKPVYVNAKGVHGREMQQHAEDDLLLQALSRRAFHPSMDSPFTPYAAPFHRPSLGGDDFEDHETPALFDGLGGGHHDEEEEEEEGGAHKGRVRSRRGLAVVQGGSVALGTQTLHTKERGEGEEEREMADNGRNNGKRRLHGGEPNGPKPPPVVIRTNSSLLDPLTAFTPYRLQFGDTSYLDTLMWSNGKDDGQGVFGAAFQGSRARNGRGDHDDFEDYNMLGMVMDCEMIEGMGMDHATMLMQGVTMRHMPMWMGNAHGEMKDMDGMGMGGGGGMQHRHRQKRALIGLQTDQFFPQPQPFTLLARDMQVKTQINLTDRASMAAINKWADAGVLNAAKTMQQGLGVTPPPDSNQPVAPTLYVKDEHNLNCATCNVGGLQGVGASACSVGTDCQDMAAQGHMFDWDGVQFKPTAVSIWDVVLTSDTQNATDQLGEAVRSVITGSLAKDMRVTVFPDVSGIDFLDAYKAPAEDSPDATSLHPSTHRLKAVVVTSDLASVDKVASLFKTQTFQNKLASTATISLGGNSSVGSLLLTLDKTLKIPAYNAEEVSRSFEDDHPAAVGSNSVRVVSHGNGKTMNVHTVTRTQSYDVLLENFPPGITLKAFLQPSSPAGASTYSLGADTVTDAKGAAVITWKVPLKAKLASGDYVVKATDPEGTVSGVSGVISVSDSLMRRKAYGPFVEL